MEINRSNLLKNIVNLLDNYDRVAQRNPKEYQYQRLQKNFYFHLKQYDTKILYEAARSLLGLEDWDQSEVLMNPKIWK